MISRKYGLVFAVALATRLVAAARVLLLDRDGVWYLLSADHFAKGDWKAGVAFHYPPAYPVLCALAERAGLDPEPAGILVSALAGAIGAVLVAAIASRAGPRAAWVAGLVAALHPGSVGHGCDVTADALFATCLLGALLAAQRSRWGTSGLLAAASYLARPEGIVAVAVFALRARRRAPLVLAAAAVVVAPYVLAIRAEPMMSGAGAGAWKVTRKREVLRESGATLVFARGEDGARHFSADGAREFVVANTKRVLWQSYHVLHAGKELLAVLAVLLLFRRPPPPPLREAGGGSGAGAVLLPLVLLVTYSAIRHDPRYGIIIFTLFLPALGVWMSRLATRRWLLALCLLVPLLPATRPRNSTKVTWREAGVLCTGYERIAAEDPRVAFYAHAPVFLDLHVMSIEEAKAKGAQVAVFRDDDSPPAGIGSRTRTILVSHPGQKVEPVRIVPLQ